MVVKLGEDVTVDAMVTTVQTKATLPNTPTLLPSTSIITLLNDQMRGKVMPLIKKVKEEYWVTNLDYSILATQTYYPVPYRSMGAAYRAIFMVDNNGNELKLTKYEIEDRAFPLIPYGSPYFPLGFVLKGNTVGLFPPQATNYTSYMLRMYYERRPSTLISSASCGQITSFNQGASTITLNFVPTSWGTSTTIDVINNLPPFDAVLDDVGITNIAGLVVTVSVPAALASTFWANVAVNNWAAPSMTTPIPQLPLEAFPLLASYGAKSAYEAIGDTQAINNSKSDIEDSIMLLNSMLTQRVEGSPKTLAGRGGIMDAGRSMFGNFGGS